MKEVLKLPLGEKIKQIRKSKGLSQENMAHYLGCSIATISRIEQGKADCSEEMLEDIKKFLGVIGAPITDQELEYFWNRLRVWSNASGEYRIEEAQRIRNEVSIVLQLPYETDFIMQYYVYEAKHFLAMRESEQAENSLNMASRYLEEANKWNRYIYHSIEGIILSNRGMVMESLRANLKALEFKEDDINGSGLILNIARRYYEIGRLLHAQMYLEQGRKEYNKQFGDDMVSIFAIQFDDLQANLYGCIGEHSKAQKLYEKNFVKAKSLGNERHMAFALNNMGHLYMRAKKWGKAIDYFDQAHAYFKDMGAEYAITTLYQKTLCYFHLKELDQCQAMLEAMLPLAADNEEFAIKIESIAHLMTMKDSESSEYIANVTIPYLLEKHNPSAALEFCELLEEYYQKKGALKKSLEIAAISRDIYRQMLIDV